MLTHNTDEQQREQRRARKRQSLKEHRARVRAGLAVHLVAIDGTTIDLLVRYRYVTENQTTDKTIINRALSQLLWDLAHGRLKI